MAYNHAVLQGEWLAGREFLLDNRIYQNQPGYEVISPFRLQGGQVMLVNRGWIAKSAINQLTTPDKQPPPKGTLYLPQKGFTLGKAIMGQAGWPRTTLYLDLPALSEALQQPLSSLMLVLDADDPNSLTRIWNAVVVTPERHYAYALQWYGLALAFLVFGFIWRKNSKGA